MTTTASWPNQTIVVIGANSFAAEDFIDLALQRNARVIGISRSPESPAIFRRRRDDTREGSYQFLQRDLTTDVDQIVAEVVASGASAVVNYAAESEVWPSWENPEIWLNTNSVAFAGLIRRLVSASLPETFRFLQVSTCEVYGYTDRAVDEKALLNPSTPYAVSKACADMLLKVYVEGYSFPAIIVRPTNVYGARQRPHKLMPRTVLRLARGLPVELQGDGTIRKAFIHIRDVSAAEWLLLETGVIGEVYNVSPDEDVAVGTVVDMIVNRYDAASHAAVVRGPSRRSEDRAYNLDSAKIRALGWEPRTSLDDGVDEVIEWCKAHGDAVPDEHLTLPRHKWAQVGTAVQRQRSGLADTGAT